MRTPTWSLQRVLAYAWVACLSLLLLTSQSPLQFKSRTTHVLVMWMAWLFFGPAMSYAASFMAHPGVRQLLHWLPRVEWAGLVLLVALWGVSLPFLSQPPGWRYFFPVADPDYASAEPLLRRGAAEGAYEVHLDEDPQAYTKPVRVRFLPLLLVWVRPLQPASLDSSWTLRSFNGLEYLAPSYRPAAKADLARRHYLDYVVDGKVGPQQEPVD